MTDKKVWLITGTSSGVGRELVAAALEQGYRVVASARTPEDVRALVAPHPDRALAVRLDVTDEPSIDRAVRDALEQFGRIDVVVNNAGYGLIGAVEEPSDAQIRRQFDTNVFGVVNVLRQTLPVLREQGAGHVINVSSCLGLLAFASYGYYSATKFALQGLSEALAQELAPLGINVTIAEPGSIRTDFVSRGIVRPEHPRPEAYPSTHAITEYLTKTDGTQNSDPRKIARSLIEITEMEHPPFHAPLGEDAYQVIEQQLHTLGEAIRLGRERSLTTGF
jgi:NAD(P)-dependent dehydrogenase (short-subunit alcohol dehydrogenase family)